MIYQSGQVGSGKYLHALHQGGLGRVGGRHIYGLEALVPGHGNHRKYSVGMAKASIEGQLTQEDSRLHRTTNLTGAQENRDGQG